MLAVLKEFRRRQRQASLLVAGSLAAAFLLTLGGFVLIANLVSSEPAKSEKSVRRAPLDVNRVERPERGNANDNRGAAWARPIPAKAVVNAPTPRRCARPGR